MQRKSLFVQTMAVIVFFTLFYIIGCTSNNPISPDNGDKDADINQSVKTVSASSVSIFNNVSSFKQVSTFIQGSDAIVDLEIPEVKNPQTALNFASSIQQKAFTKVKHDTKILNKTQSIFGESVIWDVTYRDEKKGVTYRSSLIYNNDSGEGRLFFVGFDFSESHPLTYDSTEIIVNLNFTIFDDSDDVLISLENLKRFKPGRLIQEEKASFVPDSYAPGSEPTGGVLTSDITYSNSSFISHSHAQFEYHEGSGGSFSKESNFADGSSSRVEVTFKVDGTGTFSEMRRDGTQIEGTFDSADEDGEGSYTKMTTFPAGHDPISISESGEFTINSVDSTLNGSFEKEIKLKDGSVENEKVNVKQTLVDNIKTTTLNVENRDGSGGLITIVESPEVDQVSGEWRNVDETFLVFSAEYYQDDSAHLEFKLYASETAFQNGEAPIASGEFDFYPDGSGRGTVTEGEQTYEVTIHPDGSVTIVEVTA